LEPAFFAQSQTQDQAPLPARSRADETLDRWNGIGNKLIAMAQDFPEDKYDYKLQKDERTFALNLLHATALDYVLDVIKQPGDAGLDKTSKLGNKLRRNSDIWMFAIEHSAEHYGQLVVYYRANNMVPPDSRR
jgi:hypothetical protein